MPLTKQDNEFGLPMISPLRARCKTAWLGAERRRNDLRLACLDAKSDRPASEAWQAADGFCNAL